MSEIVSRTKREEVIMPLPLTNPGQEMHYVVMTLDDWGRPQVLKRVATNMPHVPKALYRVDPYRA